MNWTEVNVYTTTEGIEPVCGRLLGVGVTGFAIKDAKDFEDFLNDKTGNWDYIDDDLMNLKNCETCVTFYLADNSQGADMLAMVRSEMAELAALDTEKKFGRLVCELSNVREEDWANNWKQYFKPLNVGNRLVIKPSWEQLGADNDRVVLELDPENSFGTGRHHTTRLCLELVEKYVKDGDRVCDLGCGSGIISIAAVLLGAKSAVAVDISPDAAVTAKANANKNGISDDCYTAYCGDVVTDGALREKIGNGYELVAANIVADVLLAMADVFKCVTAKGGTLVLSGIITGRCDEVFDAMRQRGFEMLETTECEMWNAAAFKKL